MRQFKNPSTTTFSLQLLLRTALLLRGGLLAKAQQGGENSPLSGGVVGGGLSLAYPKLRRA